MHKSITALVDQWPDVAACLTAGKQPWPKVAVEADWLWWLKQKEAGKLRALPGRHTLARRWSLRENQVRLFLLAKGTFI